MTRYIWITIGVIVLIVALGIKQAPNEPAFDPQDRAAADEAAISEFYEGEPVVSESGNIKITRPQPDAAISSPFLIKGEARVFEGMVQFRLKDAQGNVLVEKLGTAAAAEEGEFGSFGELMLYNEVTTDKGMLEVFSVDAGDGSEIDMVQIPITFE